MKYLAFGKFPQIVSHKINFFEITVGGKMEFFELFYVLIIMYYVGIGK